VQPLHSAAVGVMAVPALIFDGTRMKLFFRDPWLQQILGCFLAHAMIVRQLARSIAG
jgi:hypothetical protein